MIFKTFKYRLYPSSSQLRLLEETLETCRRWYNTCLAERKEAWEKEHRSLGKYEQLREVKAYRKVSLIVLICTRHDRLNVYQA